MWETARQGPHNREAGVAREGRRAEPRPWPNRSKDPWLWHRDGRSKAVFQNCPQAGDGPPRTSAAELASKTPGSPDFQLSAQEASRPRAPQRAGPGTRLCFFQHSLGVQDRTIVAGLWWSHATGATPPKPSQRLRASQPPQAPLCTRPRPLRAGPAPAVFLFPSPRGQPPLRS